VAVTYLDRILAHHRDRVAGDRRDLAALAALAADTAPTRGFRSALAAAAGLGVIAEVKRRSPSRGDLNPGLDPAVLAADYERGGATCLSVLTDAAHFGGSADDLRRARAATGLPVLRKDFTVAPVDVYETRIIGADAVLLIAAALDDDELVTLHGLARDLGLDVLVEIHDEAELERAVSIGADLVGVNQRDLVTFEVDQQRAGRLAPLMPPDVVRVAESGVRGPGDGALLASVGYHAVLVGEALVTSGDAAQATAALRACA